MLKVGSLFSGIGGLELGLEWTGGFKTIWQCENNAYASAVLKKHWPDVPNFGDISLVHWDEVQKPDVLCGGFPCQDISVAGKGAGIEKGTRSSLWFEFAKAIRTLRPPYVLIENVPALARRGLGVVLADLAEAGYDAEWHNISAASVGAWHRRERIFIIAYPASMYESFDIPAAIINNITQDRRETKEIGSGNRKNRARRTSLVSNTVFPRARMEEHSGSGQGRASSSLSKSEILRQEHGEIGAEGTDSNRSDVSHSISRRFEQTATERIKRHHAQNRAGIWAVEPNVVRVANGIPKRVDRIKCLGNAVVPQVAQVVGEMILEMEKQVQ